MIQRERQPCYHAAVMKSPIPTRGTAEVETVEENSVSLRELVEKAQAGDVEAFEVLYRQHLGRVYALCLRMCGGPQEAEELTQEAFVRAWEKLQSFRHRSSFSSWLHRLTVNVVLGRWRSNSRRRERVVILGDVATSDIASLDDLAASRVAPSKRGTRLDLERAIARLPTGARTVLVLHDIEGYRHRDIAEITGLKEGTSKAQLHRARKLLRESLA